MLIIWGEGRIVPMYPLFLHWALQTLQHTKITCWSCDTQKWHVDPSMLILQHTEIKFSSKVGKSVCTEILFVKTDERDREFSSCSVKCGQKVCFYREFFSVCPGSPNVKAQRAFVCPDSPSVKVYTPSLVCTDSPNVKVYRTSLSRQSKHKGIQSIFYLSRQSKGKSIQISLSRQSKRKGIQSIFCLSRQSKRKSIQISLSRQSKGKGIQISLSWQSKGKSIQISLSRQSKGKSIQISLSWQSKRKGIQSIFCLSRLSKRKSIQISLSRQSIRESIHSILFVQTVKVYKESCVCPGSPTVKVYREPVANFSTLTKTKKLSAVFPLVNARFPSYKVFQIKTELFVSVLQVWRFCLAFW